jgi:hypothetical protein
MMTANSTASLSLVLLVALCFAPSCAGETDPGTGGSGGSRATGGAGNSGGRGGSAGASDCTTIQCFRAIDCVEYCGGPVLESGCCPCATGTFDSIQCSGGGGSGGAGGVNCALVGCAAPPLCSTGCTEVCGCCPCADGTTSGSLICTGGCWAVCRVGADQSCNDNPAISSIHGRCQSDGTCVCNNGFAMNPATGRCL